MAVFKARYRGTCDKCKQGVEPGQYVSWSRRARGIIYHARCIGEQEPDDASPQSPQAPQFHDTAQQEQPQREPTPHVPSISEERVRAIAQEEDAGQLGKLLAAVETRLETRETRELVIKVREKDGTVKEVKRVESGHSVLPRLVYLISKRRHAYLYGPPGSGKSTGAFMAFKALDLAFGYCSLNPQTPESRLLGFIDAGGVYRETEFYRRYTQGGGFVIDEMDNAHPALLNTLNGMLETDEDGVGRGAFPCGVVERHPDFVCVGTGNTNGRGGDKLFPERRALDAAFMERFSFLVWGYDLALERRITLAANPEQGKAWLDWTRSVRGFVGSHGIRLWVSPRASVGGATLLKDSGWPVRDIADAVLFKGLDSDTVDRILGECPLPSFDTPQVQAPAQEEQVNG